MGLLPVPAEVKDMHHKVDQLLEALYQHSLVFETLGNGVQVLERLEKRMKDIEGRIDQIQADITFLKDNSRFNRVG